MTTKYTVRTCHCCGIRKPQPQMNLKEIYVETGKSKGTVSDATWVGAILGNKQSVNSVNRWLFNTSQRTYMRKRQVWLCSSCEGSFKTKTDSDMDLGKIIGGILGLLLIGLLVLGDDDKKPSQPEDATVSTTADQ